MGVGDMTERAAVEHWEGRKGEPCACGGHYESYPFRTMILVCHRGTDGRLLCTTPYWDGRMVRGEEGIDPIARAHDELAVAAHGGNA